MVQVQLWLLTLNDLLPIYVNVNMFCLAKNLETGIDGDGLAYSQVEDGIVAIGHILQIDE